MAHESVVDSLRPKSLKERSIRADARLVVFFESYSILRVLCMAHRIWRARIILFMRSGFVGRESTIKKQFVRALIGAINRRAEVRQLSISELAPERYLSNREGAEIADTLGPWIQETIPYRILLDVVGDAMVLLFYKACLALKIPDSFLYARIANELIQRQEEVVVVPDNLERLREGIPPEAMERIREHTSPLIRFTNRLPRAVKIGKYAFQTLLLPAIVFILHLRNGFLRRPQGPYGVAMPVLWGVFKDSEARIRGDVRRFNDDMYLYGQHFYPGDIVHIFGDWKFSTEVKKSYQEAMGEKGIPYVDREWFGVNWALFCLTLKTTRKVIQALFRRGNPALFAPALWEATMKGLYHFLLKRYEMENVDYRLELVRNDYNPGHIIATIVAHQHGRKRVGVSHAASPYDAPQMCFIHFDRYAVSCHLYVRTFSPFWNSLKLEKIGRESIDSVVREMSRRDEIKKELESLYGKRRWTIIILLPGTAQASLVEQWDKMYRALLEFRDHDLDCHLFLRFRSVDLAREKPHMGRFLSLPETDRRIILDHDNFNTHELMVASNLVIAASASFGINEALVAGVPVFTFGYTQKEHLYFPDYGEDFILRETEDVLRVLDGVKRGFKEFDCAWDRLWKDADYFHDGKNGLRLGDLVFSTLQDVWGGDIDKCQIAVRA